MVSSLGGVGGGFVSHLSWGRRLSVALATSIAFVGPSFGATADSKKADTEGLIASAAQAEARGDVSKSLEILHEIIRIDPENQRAHWQLGQIKVDKQWVAVEEAQRRTSADPLQGEYRERRAAVGDRAQEQLAIAKWARKNGLSDEAFYHWTRVLAADPKNAEALHALDLRWQNGRLMSREQIADHKAQMRNAKRAAERWAPKIVGWRRAVSGQDSAARDAALSGNWRHRRGRCDSVDGSDNTWPRVARFAIVGRPPENHKCFHRRAGKNARARGDRVVGLGMRCSRPTKARAR